MHKNPLTLFGNPKLSTVNGQDLKENEGYWLYMSSAGRKKHHTYPWVHVQGTGQDTGYRIQGT